MAGWHDTLDIMLRLRDWWGSQDGVRFGDAFIESVDRKQPDMVPDASRGPGWLSSVARSHIDNGEPFFVSPEVFEMVDAASQTFGSEPLQATDLITPGGFVLLPKPFFSVDRHGKQINTRAFSWGPCQSSTLRVGEGAPAVGTYILLYADATVEDDFYESMQKVRRMWSTTYGYSLWHMSPWWFGQGVPLIEDFAGASGYPGNRYLWKWVQAFFRLSMQQIVTAQYTIPARPYARRAKRAGRDPGVLVMSLRRRQQHHYADGDGEGPDWQFQWITRGHWRNQWYPKLGLHRQIWIAPFLKGPENKPFKRPDLRAWTFNR